MVIRLLGYKNSFIIITTELVIKYPDIISEKSINALHLNSMVIYDSWLRRT
jgi:hypothetical protein